MKRRVLYLLVCGQCLLYGQLDPSQALLEIRRQIAASISRLPNYLCTQTVDRQTLEPNISLHAHSSCEQIIESVDKSSGDFKIVSSDRLRLDVALNAKAEMYSWVGEGRFDDRELSEIVRRGTTSTGAFGSFLHAIFATDSASFTFKGEAQLAGRQVLEYGFEVPITRSGYIVSNETINRVTGYTGTFTADAKTLDLLRLEIRTDALPTELRICRSITALDYTKIKMNGVDVLLPSEVNVRMLAGDGRESHNRTIFSGCHQFMGESKLIFDDVPAEGGTAASAMAKAKTFTLSDGLKVSVALTQAVNLETAAAGDPVTGRLTRPIKDLSNDLIIPKGTKVNGRIFGLLSYYLGSSGLEFGLKWESIELDGVKHPLDLLVKSAGPGSANLPMVHGRWLEISATFRPEERGVGFFLLQNVGKHYQIPSGFETEWVTLPASAETK
jgi:hypothetical protein